MLKYIINSFLMNELSTSSIDNFNTASACAINMHKQNSINVIHNLYSQRILNAKSPQTFAGLYAI